MGDSLAIAALLDINEKAIELLSMINFLFVLTGETHILLRDCMGKDIKEINKYVFKKRKERIMSTEYSSIDLYLDDFQVDKKGALEKLFQEPITEAKMKRINSIDPARIFEIHSSNKPNLRIMDILQYV